MGIKKLLLNSTIAVSLISTSVSFAHQDSAQAAPGIAPKHQGHKGHNRLLTAAQQKELHEIVRGMNEQMLPLLKTKEALNTQIKGKIATPNVLWSDIAPLVNQLNENNAKITTLFAKTQLSTFSKLGVLLPSPHERHHLTRHIG